MGSLSGFLLAALLPALSNVNALPYPFNVAGDGVTSLAVSPATIIQQLGPQLASNATIYGKNNTQFANATTRWNAYAEPQFVVVVEPGTELDVAITVSYQSGGCAIFATRVLNAM